MQQLLPPLDSHPKGRIAIAHMYSVLEGVFGKPIDQVRDCRLQDALDILKFTMDNAKEYSIMKPLRANYLPEPDDVPPTTLDAFFE
jgi:hypothetical protein